MPVKIITDSPSDVPAEIAKEFGITVIPIHVLFGTQSFRDGIDLTTEQFYHRLVHSKVLPTTAVSPIGTIADVYDRLAEEADGIVAITLSRKFSAFNEVALKARELMKKKCRVEVVDSQAGAMAEGLIVIAAAKAANAGASLDEVVKLTQCNIPRTEIRMAFDTLEYLKRGGRIGRAQALLGSVLRVNPILGIRDGEACPVARERSRAGAIKYLYSFAMSFSRIDEMAVEDTACTEEADLLMEGLGSIFPKERIYRSGMTPVIGTHTGPGLLLVAIMGDK